MRNLFRVTMLVLLLIFIGCMNGHDPVSTFNDNKDSIFFENDLFIVEFDTSMNMVSVYDVNGELVFLNPVDVSEKVLSITCGLIGDSNTDGVVSYLDVTADVNFILGRTSLPFSIECADVTGDGVVDVLDIIATLHIILGTRTDTDL